MTNGSAPAEQERHASHVAGFLEECGDDVSYLEILDALATLGLELHESGEEGNAATAAYHIAVARRVR